MKIGIDMRMAGGGAGISRYIESLASQILALDKNKYVLFFNRLDSTLRSRFASFGAEMVETGIGHYTFDEQYKLPSILNKYDLDLVHFPHFNVPVLYRKPFVVTIHDLTHTRFPGRKKSRIIHRLAYNFILKKSIQRSKKIIAVSQSTKKEILEFFPRTPSEKIMPIYEGVAPGYRIMNKHEAFEKLSPNFQIKKPFLLYVGVWRRYKNLPALAQAFDLIAEKHGLDLVLAGAEDPYYPEIKEQILGIKNAHRVRILGRVSDEDLNLLYNAAELMVLPSFYEGFGLTVLEAAACGTPVACSDIPTLREVMGQAAEYFDPNNIENMADVLSGIIASPNRAEELANLGLSRVKHFSWKQAALETINVYKEAIK
ncbi:MAG: glycosyltransferase family 4 protein [Acidobacteriaceae bacterium]